MNNNPPASVPPSRDVKEDSAAGKISRPDTMLGEFKILRKLGQGGMSDVYLAEQTSLKRNVAVKILKKELLSNPNSIERFRTEATAVAGLNHQNIVQVYTIGEWKGMHYMVQEYVQGQNMRDYVTRKGTPDFLLAVHIMKQVAMALQQANLTGVVHRDIKPENILINRKGEIKVADFGLAKILQPIKDLRLTEAGMTMGTPMYMSPEQIRGLDVDHRSDLYSFGVTCYYILAGETPFKGSDSMAVAMAHLNEAAVPLEHLRPDLPVLLCRIIDKLMRKKKEERYPSASAVLKELRRLGDEQGRGMDVQPLTTQELPETDSPDSAESSGKISAFLDQPIAAQIPWLLIAVILAGAVAVGGGWWNRTHDPMTQKLMAPGNQLSPAPTEM